MIYDDILLDYFFCCLLLDDLNGQPFHRWSMNHHDFMCFLPIFSRHPSHHQSFRGHPQRRDGLHLGRPRCRRGERLCAGGASWIRGCKIYMRCSMKRNGCIILVISCNIRYCKITVRYVYIYIYILMT